MPGERNTAEAVLDDYGDAILRLAYSYLKNRADAEDVLQDTLIQYITRAPKFESREHEKAWLLRVCINRCKNLLLTPWRQRREELSGNEPCFQSEDTGVLEAVTTLPVKYREVIHLFYMEGYSTRELSMLLGRSEEAVRKQLSRGRELLRACMKEGSDFEE